LIQVTSICNTSGMTTDVAAAVYKGFRFPQQRIAHTVWLDYRFSLNCRDIEELLAERGIIVMYEPMGTNVRSNLRKPTAADARTAGRHVAVR
jgi:transposase-like protein